MFISVVSHGHGNLIINLGTLKSLATEHSIILTDNIGENNLKMYCIQHGIHYILNEYRKGFGDNNNQNYKFAVSNINMTDADYFLVLNPDVVISTESLLLAQENMMVKNAQLATINLYKSENEFDGNVRNFPVIKDFIESYLFRKNRTIIDKNEIYEQCYVDWASGSFLIFKSELYNKISGFDTNYFMYCEDLDICRRAHSYANQKVLYINNVKALHIAAHNNRKLFSKHFLWHVKSVLRYCFISKY